MRWWKKEVLYEWENIHNIEYHLVAQCFNMLIVQPIGIKYYVYNVVVRKTHNIKSANVQQAQVTYNFKHIKEKFLETDAAVLLNKICKNNQLTRSNN
jgi:hypothetical protein